MENWLHVEGDKLQVLRDHCGSQTRALERASLRRSTFGNSNVLGYADLQLSTFNL